jgi:predicted nucleic acid-binding protein
VGSFASSPIPSCAIGHAFVCDNCWPQARDPNDEMVLEAAINGRGDALVTYNVADFTAPAERFRISVLRPAELLKKVKP